MVFLSLLLLPPVPCERSVGTQMYLKFEVNIVVGCVCVGLAALHISKVEKIMKGITYTESHS